MQEGCHEFDVVFSVDCADSTPHLGSHEDAGGGMRTGVECGQLEGYFRGGLTEFSVPLRTPGTEFQRLVWSRLRAIPSGTTRTYSGIAAEFGRPTAVRAVARANGDNRIAILIPCHRVVGSDGKLTGYGGGLWRKQRLLEIEQEG